MREERANTQQRAIAAVASAARGVEVSGHFHGLVDIFDADRPYLDEMLLAW